MTKNKLGNYGISGVYMIKNINTGDFYVGSSKNIGKRWNEHTNKLLKGIHNNIFLQRSFNKYGICSFIFGIIKETEDLLRLEQYYIDEFKPQYNLAKYAYGGMRGRTLSEDHILSIKKANTGRKLTKEHIEKSRISRTGLKYPAGFWKNSVEARQKPVIVYLYGKTYYFKSSKDACIYFGIENVRSFNNSCANTLKYKNLLVKYGDKE